MSKYKNILIIIGIITILSYSVNADLNSDLVSYYSFDNDFNNDYSNDNNFNVMGDTVLDTGLLDNAVSFDGTGDYLYNDSLTSIQDGTLNLWVNFDSFTNGDTLFHTTSPSQWYCQYSTTKGGVFCDLPGTDYTFVNLNTSEWSMITISHSNPTTKIYLNSVEVYSNSNSGLRIQGTDIYLGCNSVGTTCIDGKIDEFVSWSQILSQSDINDLYNNRNGYNFLPPTGGQVDLKLLTKNRLTYVNISEIDEFFISINYSNAGIELLNGSCNFTAYNNVSGTFRKFGENVTLQDIITQEELIFNENTNVIIDTTVLTVCKETVSTPTIELYINDVLFDSINTELPQCDTGTHLDVNVTYDYIASSNINFTVKCLDCNAGRRARILKDNSGSILRYARRFSEKTESDLIYNSSSKLYEFTNYSFVYANTNYGNITVSCNDTTQNFIIPIEDINLSLNITSIDNIPYVDNMQVESSDNTTIIIEITNDIFTFLEFNVTYENGTLIKSINEEIMILHQDELNKNGVYNISIIVTDNENNNFFNTGFFRLNDTTNPTINFINPTNSSQKLFNTTIPFQILFKDTNLFAYEVLVYNNFNILQYNYSLTNINTTIVLFNEFINLNTVGNWTINATVSDDHTRNNIKDYKIKTDYQDFTIEDDIGNITIKYSGIYSSSDVELIKLNDRYNFVYDFYLYADKFSESVKHKFLISCKDIVYRKNSNYNAHFVCPLNNKWADFENEYSTEFKVTKSDDDEYEIEIEMEPYEHVVFNSIGGLNIVSEFITFEVALEPTSNGFNLFNMDFTESLTFLILFAIFLLMCMFFMIGYLFKSIVPMLGFLILGIILGLALLPLNSFVSMSVLAFVIVCMFVFFGY